MPQLSGLGYDGPYAGRGGFDLIAQGMGGIMHVTGEPDGPPTSVGLPICARCADALGPPEWCDDPRFATNQQRMENRAALEDVMEAVLTAATTDHWVEVLEAAGVPCGPVYNYQQMFADPQVRHRGLVQ